MAPTCGLSRKPGIFMCSEHRQTGLTLIELIITIVVLSAGVVGIVLAYAQIITSSADPVRTQQAVAVAESYMEEILGRECDLSQPLGASGDRDLWQYVQDYDDLEDSPPRLLGADDTDAPLPSFTVNVAVAQESLNSVDGCAVTVTVDDGAQVELSLTGFRAPSQ